MKRNLFFWLEKLKITRVERNAVTALMAMLLILVLVKNILPEPKPYDDNYYLALEKEFKKRTELLRQKENTILARYEPRAKEINVVVQDTITKDTTVSSTKLKDYDRQPKGSAARVNINTADAKTLESLPGIGPAYAMRIVEYRSKNGLFTSYDELLKIKGIGKKRLEKLLPFIQLKEPIENK